MKSKKQSPPLRRMTPADVQSVAREIAAWSRGDREGVLTWEKLVEFSGFSRQSLWAKESIKDKFESAKRAIKKDPIPKVTRRTVDERVVAYQKQIAELKSVVNRYDELWARIEYNSRAMGVDPNALRKPLRPLARDLVRKRGKR